tara:strand:- start:74 stop:1480 length:1407 start_codon:yes stop_codon:yes gene_type:complete
MIIILPIEVKDRELLTKLLIGYFLLKKSKKVKLVLTKSSTILSKKNNLSKIIYFEKSLSSQKIIPHKKLLKNNYVVSLDEEGPFYHWSRLFIENRINLKIINDNNFKYFFLWGNNEKKFFKNELINKNKKKIVTTGHPKFDFLRSNYQKIFKEQINYIKKKYGDYIYISSSFFYDSVMNEDLYKIYVEKTFKNKFSAINFNQNLDNDYENYIGLVNLTKKLAINNPKKTFIFRPHPRQDLKKVFKRFGKIPKNLKIVYKFTATPWIICSKYFIHSHCTTVYEALVLQKRIFCYRENLNTFYKNSFINYGKFSSDFNTILNDISNSLLNKRIDKPQNSSLTKLIYLDKKKPSSEIISNYIFSEFKNLKSYMKIYKDLNKNKSYVNRYKILSIIKNMLYHNFFSIYKLAFKYLPINPNYIFTKDYKENKIKNIRLNELKKIFKKFNQIHKKKYLFIFKKINDEIYEIKRK